MCEREMCVTADKTNYKSVINTRTKESRLTKPMLAGRAVSSFALNSRFVVYLLFNVRFFNLFQPIFAHNPLRKKPAFL